MSIADTGDRAEGSSSADRGMANAEATSTIVIRRVRRHLQKDQINNNSHEQNGEYQIKAKQALAYEKSSGSIACSSTIAHKPVACSAFRSGLATICEVHVE